MTPAELKEKFPHASSAFIRANADQTGRTDFQPGGGRTPAELERSPGNGNLGAVQVQAKAGQRFFVRIKTFRKRLLDEDNLCCKYYVDLLRYSSVIPSDAPGTAKIEVSQEKIGSKERERVLIEVFKI